MVSPGTTTGTPTESASAPLRSGAARPAIARGAALGEAVLSLARAVEPLWVAGLAVLCLLAVSVLVRMPTLSMPPRFRDWALYLAIGLVFPGLLVAVTMLGRQLHGSASRSALVKGVLVFLLLLTAGALVATTSSAAIIVASVVQLLLVLALTGRDGRVRPALLSGGFVVALVAWTVAARLLWWTPLASVATSSAVGFAVVALALLLACWSFATTTTTARLPFAASRPDRLANILAIVLIGLVSLRQDDLFDGLADLVGEGGAMHHWGVYVGTAELVRQGGWLYWDVPSQYGFLSILALLIVPGQSAWQALYVLNAACLFLSGVFVFLALRGLRTGVLNWVFSLATTLAAVFLVAAWPPELLATHIFPSAGGFRYIWCYALLAVLVWENRVPEGSQTQQRLLIGGSLLWLLGILWSTESAFYCSVIWLPALTMIALRPATISLVSRPSRNGLARLALWLALPVGLAATAVAGILAIYGIFLGHLPDPRAVIDYVVSFGDGTVSRFNQEIASVDPTGTILTLVLVFCVVATSAILVRRTEAPRVLGLLVGLGGALWSTASYAIARPDPSTMFRLFPFIVLAISLTLPLLSSPPVAHGWGFLYRMSVIPIGTMLLVVAFTNETALARQVQTLRADAFESAVIDDRLPTLAPDLMELLAAAGVMPSDPIIFAGNGSGNLMPAWSVDDASGHVSITRSWLPTMPFALFIPLSDERKAVYLDRYAERAKLGGWFIQSKNHESVVVNKFGAGPWFFDQLARTHVPTRVYENEGWQLSWFDYVGDDAKVVRPSFPVSGLAALTPALVVDGRPLSEQIEPETWAFFGAGWTAGDATGTGWRASLPAVLWVYSPDDQRATLRVTADATPGRATTFSISANGEASSAKRLKTGGTVEAAVDLNAGWNRVELTPAEPKRGGERATAGAGTNEFGLATLEIETEAYDAADAKRRSK